MSSKLMKFVFWNRVKLRSSNLIKSKSSLCSFEYLFLNWVKLTSSTLWTRYYCVLRPSEIHKAKTNKNSLGAPCNFISSSNLTIFTRGVFRSFQISHSYVKFQNYWNFTNFCWWKLLRLRVTSCGIDLVEAWRIMSSYTPLNQLHMSSWWFIDRPWTRAT